MCEVDKREVVFELRDLSDVVSVALAKRSGDILLERMEELVQDLQDNLTLLEGRLDRISEAKCKDTCEDDMPLEPFPEFLHRLQVCNRGLEKLNERVIDIRSDLEI